MNLGLGKRLLLLDFGLFALVGLVQEDERAGIGRRLKSPTVRTELRHSPCGALFAAAMHKDEDAQIREAIRWRIGRSEVSERSLSENG